MNLEFVFKLINKDTDEEMKQGDTIKIALYNGEIVCGYLDYTDGIALSITRKDQSEEYDFGEIKSLSKIENFISKVVYYNIGED